MFAAFVFFRNEEKNKVEEAKGGKSVPKEAGAGQGRGCAAQGSLINLCLMLNAAPWSCVQRGWDGGRGGPGGRKRREQRCWRGWGKMWKKQNSSRAEEGRMEHLIRREHEQKLQEHMHAHTLCSTPSPPREKKFITPIFSWSGSQVIKLSDEGPILLSCSHFRQVHHVWNNEADLIKFSLAEAATLIWRWAY